MIKKKYKDDNFSMINWWWYSEQREPSISNPLSHALKEYISLKYHDIWYLMINPKEIIEDNPIYDYDLSGYVLIEKLGP